MAGCQPPNFYLTKPGKVLDICISRKQSNGVDAAGLVATLRAMNLGQALILKMKQGIRKGTCFGQRHRVSAREVRTPVHLSHLTVEGTSHHLTAHTGLTKGIPRMSLSINKDPWCLILM